jgi:membrane associated rhomboid family serine protease
LFIPIRDHNPTRRVPIVNYTLMAANVLVWLLQIWAYASGANWIVPEYGLVPIRLTLDPGAAAFTLLTSIFMHGDWLHLGSNMLFLHVFGDNVEDVLGRARYLVFYLASGVLASLGHYLIDPLGHAPMVGASGAIFGVLGAYVVVFPRAPVVVFNPYFFLWFVLGPLPDCLYV